MTQTDFNQQKYKPLAMPGPFGYDGLVETPKTSVDPANPNFHDGFPVAYGSPKSLGGQYITRSEMNGIGNLASRYEFFKRIGGLNTFDPDFAAQIGGYPKGAVLKYLNNGYLYDVISLVDNNTYNFVENGVDEINWQYLSIPEKILLDDVFFDGGSGVTPGMALLGTVKATKTAGLRVVASIDANIGDRYYIATPNTNIRGWIGCGIMILDCGTSEPSDVPFPEIVGTAGNFSVDWNDWKSISGDFGLYQGKGSGVMEFVSNRQNSAGFMPSVIQGHYYAIGLMCGEGDIDVEGGDFLIREYDSTSGTLKLTYST